MEMLSTPDQTPMVQITRRGAAVHAAAGQIEELKGRFSERHCILLPQLLDSEILNHLLAQISASNFEERDDSGIARESWLPGSPVVAALGFLLNAPEFVRFLEEVTGCRPVTFIGGRVYRFNPGGAHGDGWHNDIMPPQKRLLAISINLSPEPFEGGELVIRRRESKEVVSEIANTGLGNAVIFRVDERLEHRVSPLRGTRARTAFAGWFFDDVEFHKMMREQKAASPPLGKSAGSQN